ncbi:hypothetical protein DPX16_21305 [Anabarilius grahami]|uniref:Uncharacterized protein n=1 Tax=Anabarilius grahami TaxID=495550 RepID=A0A3N0Y071_ANAGA|nr:hypothetical protein DPX16_21305 [Anabarilius grahami]
MFIEQPDEVSRVQGMWMADERGADETRRHSQQTRRTLGILEHAGDSAVDEDGDACQVCVISILVKECIVTGTGAMTRPQRSPEVSAEIESTRSSIVKASSTRQPVAQFLNKPSIPA